MRTALKTLHDLARGAAVCIENSIRANVGFKFDLEGNNGNLD
jgi:hypothetical protein